MLRTVEESRAFFAGDVFAMEGCGIQIERVTETGAVCSMEVAPAHLNANQVVQGGAVFTLCDTAFAVAANAHGVPTVSQNANISYLKPAKGARLTAEAQEVSTGKSTCVYQVRVYNDQQALVAYATVTGFRLKPREL